MRFDFWGGDMDYAADMAKKKFPDSVAQTVGLADGICDNSFVFRGHWEMERTNCPVNFSGKINWHHLENKDPEWMYALNRHSIFVTLGKAWRYTNDTKYCDALVRLWHDWLENVPFCEENKNTSWRSIETGLRCENWLRSLALFEGSSAISPNLREQIKASLKIHGMWLLEAHKPFHILSNWGVLQDHGLFLLGLSLGERNWAGIAIERLCQELKVQVMDDGTHWEQSPMYHCEVLHCCLNAMLAAKRAEFECPPEFISKTRDMLHALALLIRPDGLLLCQGDSDEVDARDLLALGAFLFNDGKLKAYAGNNVYEENVWDMADMMCLYDSITLKPRLGSSVLSDSGNAMLWDDKGNNSGFLHFSYGCLGSGHGHADSLHVDLVCNGESILIDPGRYTYVDSPIRLQLKSPKAHNVARVDNQDFTVCKGSWGCAGIAEPLKGSFKLTPSADYVSGAHLGYISLGVLHRRHVLRIGKGLWIIWDAFYTQKSECHTYEQYFHFGLDGKAEKKQHSDSIVYYGKKASAEMIFCAKPDSITINPHPASREYNRMEKCACVKAEYKAQGFFSAPVVVSAQAGENIAKTTAEIIPVSLLSEGRILPQENSQGLVVCSDKKQATIIMCHKEVISEVDFYLANGKFGYGKVLIFNDDHPDGICLGW